MLGKKGEIKIEIIGKERKFFGFGEEKVKVKAAFNEPPADIGGGKVAEAAGILQKLLDGMRFDARVEGKMEGDAIYLKIFSEYGGIIIGRKGETLDSLEHIIDRIVNKKLENRVDVIVDTENYRERRREKLDGLAKKLARQVKMTGRPASIASMNARDRKVIHIALQDDPSVETISEGEGFERRVVVSPKGGEARRQNTEFRMKR